MHSLAGKNRSCKPACFAHFVVLSSPCFAWSARGLSSYKKGFTYSYNAQSCRKKPFLQARVLRTIKQKR